MISAVCLLRVSFHGLSGRKGRLTNRASREARQVAAGTQGESVQDVGTGVVIVQLRAGSWTSNSLQQESVSAQCLFSPTAVGTKRNGNSLSNTDALGPPPQSLCPHHPTFPHYLILLRQSSCSVKHELGEGLLRLSWFGESLGVFPEHLFIVTGFFLPGFLDGWMLSRMTWGERQTAATHRKEGPVMWHWGPGFIAPAKGCLKEERASDPKVCRWTWTLGMTCPHPSSSSPLGLSFPSTKLKWAQSAVTFYGGACCWMLLPFTLILQILSSLNTFFTQVLNTSDLDGGNSLPSSCSKFFSFHFSCSSISQKSDDSFFPVRRITRKKKKKSMWATHMRAFKIWAPHHLSASASIPFLYGSMFQLL